MNIKLPALWLVISALLITGCESAPQPPAVESTAAATETEPQQTVSQPGHIETEVMRALSAAETHASLNAMITIADEQALSRARELDQQPESPLPLNGMLLVVKDNIHVAGMPNSAGTPALKDFIPAQDNPVITRLRAAGAIVLGKANMHELAFGITSNNAAFGAVGNAIDPTKMAGGSSGGTATAIAAGIVSAGLGTDTGGSVRIPAAHNGIVGFRPSMGRYPSGAVTPISSTRDTIGPIATDVSTIIALDTVMADEQGTVVAADLNGLRMGILRNYFFSGLDPETQRVTDAALARLQEAGVVLVEADIEGFTELQDQSSFPIALYEVAAEMPVYLQQFEAGVSMEQLAAAIASPDVAGVVNASIGDGAVPEAVYQQALQARTELRKRYQAYFDEQDLDAIVFPTTPLPARDISGSDETVALNGERVPTFPTYIRNTNPASIVGGPGISLPAGTTTEGLPVGIEIDGAENADRALLAIALAMEALLSIPDSH